MLFFPLSLSFFNSLLFFPLHFVRRVLSFGFWFVNRKEINCWMIVVSTHGMRKGVEASGLFCWKWDDIFVSSVCHWWNSVYTLLSTQLYSRKEHKRSTSPWLIRSPQRIIILDAVPADAGWNSLFVVYAFNKWCESIKTQQNILTFPGWGWAACKTWPLGWCIDTRPSKHLSSIQRKCVVLLSIHIHQSFQKDDDQITTKIKIPIKIPILFKKKKEKFPTTLNDMIFIIIWIKRSLVFVFFIFSNLIQQEFLIFYFFIIVF